jgi:hypothetical protein
MGAPVEEIRPGDVVWIPPGQKHWHTTDLSRIAGSFVIARNTAFTFKDKAIDVREIGRELGVRYLLEGSVRRTGHTVRVTTAPDPTKPRAPAWRFSSSGGGSRDVAKWMALGFPVGELAPPAIPALERRRAEPCGGVP